MKEYAFYDQIDDCESTLRLPYVFYKKVYSLLLLDMAVTLTIEHFCDH